MLEIGLIGAPGSGKSSAATKVAGHLSLDVVLSPASTLILQDIAVGSFGDYIVNLEVAMLRHAAIQARRHSNRPFITEGTLIDSLAYAGMAVEDCQDKVPTSILRNQLLREMHAATLIGCMMLDAQPVEHLFYLPLPEGTTGYEARTDDTLRDVIETYHVPVTVVSGDDVAEQIIAQITRSEKHDA